MKGSLKKSGRLLKTALVGESHVYTPFLAMSVKYSGQYSWKNNIVLDTGSGLGYCVVMDTQTKTVLEAITLVQTAIAEEVAGLMETRSDLVPNQVAATRDRAAKLRQSAHSIQAMLSAVQ